MHGRLRRKKSEIYYLDDNETGTIIIGALKIDGWLIARNVEALDARGALFNESCVDHPMGEGDVDCEELDHDHLHYCLGAI